MGSSRDWKVSQILQRLVSSLWTFENPVEMV